MQPQNRRGRCPGSDRLAYVISPFLNLIEMQLPCVGGRVSDESQRRVPPPDSQHRSPLRRLVDARNRPRSHSRVAGHRVRHIRAQLGPLRSRSSQRQRNADVPAQVLIIKNPDAMPARFLRPPGVVRCFWRTGTDGRNGFHLAIYDALRCYFPLATLYFRLPANLPG